MRDSQIESLKKVSQSITSDFNEKVKELEQIAPKLKELQDKVRMLTEKVLLHL